MRLIIALALTGRWLSSSLASTRQQAEAPTDRRRAQSGARWSKATDDDTISILGRIWIGANDRRSPIPDSLGDG